MARKSNQTESVDGSVRQRLLEGAAELFTQKGYAATTVREIVAAAGVTKPVLYYYFRNKEGIYLELMRGAFARMDDLLQAGPGGPGKRNPEAAPPLRSGLFPFHGTCKSRPGDVRDLLRAPPGGALF